MIRQLLGTIHRYLARHSSAVTVACAIRNQMDAVVRNRLSDGPDAGDNGEEWFAAAVLPAVATWIDAGANAGTWSNMAQSHVTTVRRALLLEPIPELAARLRTNYALLPEVVVTEAAVGSQPCNASFFVTSGEAQASSLVQDRHTADARKITVYVTTIDAEAERLGLGHIDLLKTDCEGFDLHALKGAERLFAAKRVSALQFEYNAQWAHAGSTLADAFSYLTRHGFEVFLLKRSGLWRFDYARYGEFFGYANFVALQPHLASALEARIHDRI